MRNSFIKSLVDFNNDGGNAFLLVGDLGYSVVEEFAASHPDNFINVGVAEQNMAGIAAGIASEGHHVFCYSIGNFNTFRCAEQIRNDIDYHNLPVCTVSVGGGVAYGNMGYSHHAIQDLALMRVFPNTTIYAPVDARQSVACFESIIANSSPSYLRLHKSGESLISNTSIKIEPGVPVFLAGDLSAKRVLLTSGFCGQGAFEYVNSNPNYSAYTLPSWGLRHREHIARFAEKFDEIFVIEDHLLDGGFCSWILESLIGTEHIGKVRSSSILTELIGLVGSEKYLHDKSNLFLLQ